MEKDEDPFGWEDMKIQQRKAVQLIKVESKSAIPGFVAIVMCDDGSLWGISDKEWQKPRRICIPEN